MGGQLGVSLVPGGRDGQHHLFVERPENVVLFVAPEQRAHLVEKLEDLAIEAGLQQRREHVAQLLLVQVLEEVFLYVYKILDVFRTNREAVEEQVQAAVSAFLAAQQFHDLPQNQVLLLLEVADPDIADFLDQPRSPQPAQMVVSSLDAEHAEPLQAAIKLDFAGAYLFVFEQGGQASQHSGQHLVAHLGVHLARAKDPLVEPFQQPLLALQLVLAPPVHPRVHRASALLPQPVQRQQYA